MNHRLCTSNHLDRDASIARMRTIKYWAFINKNDLFVSVGLTILKTDFKARHIVFETERVWESKRGRRSERIEDIEKNID